MKKLAFIENGKYRKGIMASNLIAGCTDSETTIDVLITRKKAHAIELAANAVSAGYTHLIAVGGDGTLNEVVNGMMRSKIS